MQCTMCISVIEYVSINRYNCASVLLNAEGVCVSVACPPTTTKSAPSTDTSSTQTQAARRTFTQTGMEFPINCLIIIYFCTLQSSTQRRMDTIVKLPMLLTFWWIHYSFQSVISPAFGAIAKLIKYLCI